MVTNKLPSLVQTIIDCHYRSCRDKELGHFSTDNLRQQSHTKKFSLTNGEMVEGKNYTVKLVLLFIIIYFLFDRRW